MACVDIDIDDYLDDASDFALKAELEKRGFKVFEPRSPDVVDIKEMLRDAIQAGLANRLSSDHVRRILEARSGPNMVDAYEAVIFGDKGKALALIDREFEPKTPGLFK